MRMAIDTIMRQRDRLDERRWETEHKIYDETEIDHNRKLNRYEPKRNKPFFPSRWPNVNKN